MTLRALILAVWALMHPAAARVPAAQPIADAIARAVAGEADPARWAALLAALLAVYTLRESWLTPDAIGDGGRSCGVVQLRCEWTHGMSVEGQLRLWLRLVHASSLASVDSSPSRAARRERLALELLDVVRRGVASRQPP